MPGVAATRPSPKGAAGDAAAGSFVSVVICTRNRARYVAQAIRSVLAQIPRRTPVEVVVVDNGSTDGTRGVVEAAGPAGRVRYVREERPGLCRARNTGWRAARGPYVAYLDDDAVALPGWLDTVERVFRERPSVGVVGGRALPDWEAERPPWLSDEAARVLALVDWPGGPRALADIRREWLVGANMAVRRSVLEALGGFHPSLDRVGTNLLSNGDVHLQRRALARGWSCYYHPAMAVRHTVPAARLRKHWFVRRYYWQGISDATVELVDRPLSPGRRLLEAARRAGALAGRHPRRAVALLLPTSDPESFTAKCFGWIELGHIAGLLGAARR